MATQTYKIVVDGVSEIIEADLIQYIGKTGQTLFYINEEIVTVAPANALILNAKDKVLSRKIVDFLYEKVKESNLSASIQIQEYINQGRRGEDVPILVRNSRINARNELIEELEYFIEKENQNK